MASAHTLQPANSRMLELTATENPSISILNSSSDVSSDQRKVDLNQGSSCSLKRKRPPKIEIPDVLCEIPTDTKRLITSLCRKPRADAISSTGFGVGLYSIKGKKMFMEDTHKIISCPHSYKGFFGVYDGHGGSKAAEFVAENLHTNIYQMLETCSDNTEKEEAIKAGYLKTDQDFLIKGLGSGSCCVTALIEEKELVISNVGDCRAVLCRGGKAEALTKDQRASQEDERKRIEDKGGYVEMHRGAWRVHGVLSVSRSIGDAHLKDWVLAEPDTKILPLSPEMQFLVLASDGLWEEVGNQEAVDIVMQSCLVEKKQGNNAGSEKENHDEFGCTSTSPSPKLRRVSLIRQKRRMGQSSASCRKRVENLKENVNDFSSENESPPPHKAQRISMENQMKMKPQIPSNQEYKKRPTSAGLVAACKELVNLSLTRGSSDDITVMIIDLNHFK